VHDSIIINTDSGKFSVFNSFDTNNIDNQKDEKEITEAKVYQFDRKRLYIPTHQLTQIATPKDVAIFLSRQKRGAAGKFQAIVLDNNNHITRYFFIDENLPYKALKSKLIVEVGKHGNKVILTSNGKINQSRISALKAELKSAMIDILDVLVIKQNEDILNNYVSFQETGMFEPNVPYKIGNVEITLEQRISLEEGKRIALFGVRDKTGKAHDITYVVLDRETNKIKLLQPQDKKKLKIISIIKPLKKKPEIRI
jgi:hypothetical protein